MINSIVLLFVGFLMGFIVAYRFAPKKIDFLDRIFQKQQSKPEEKSQLEKTIEELKK